MTPEKEISTYTKYATPPPKILPLLQRLKAIYFVWFTAYQQLPKTHRYTLGGRIDELFVEMIEAISVASFTPRAEKLPYIRIAIRKLDTTKVLLLVLWETKSIDNKPYILISEKLEEIGKMLGGWYGNVTKSNAPNDTPGAS